MVASIERHLSFSQIELDNQLEIYREFNHLLICISVAQGEHSLREVMKHFDNSKNFVYGFGRSHAWVHQLIDDIVSDNRLLIINF